MEMIKVGFLCYLALETRRDIREKEISVKTACIFGMTALCIRILSGFTRVEPQAMYFLFLALLPGSLLLAAGKATHQAIGYGDGILLLVCGIYLGGRVAVSLLLTGLLCLFPVSIVLLISGRARKEDALPFAPFLLMSYFLWMIWN